MYPWAPIVGGTKNQRTSGSLECWAYTYKLALKDVYFYFVKLTVPT